MNFFVQKVRKWPIFVRLQLADNKQIGCIPFFSSFYSLLPLQQMAYGGGGERGGGCGVGAGVWRGGSDFFSADLENVCIFAAGYAR